MNEATTGRSCLERYRCNKGFGPGLTDDAVLRNAPSAAVLKHWHRVLFSLLGMIFGPIFAVRSSFGARMVR